MCWPTVSIHSPLFSISQHIHTRTQQLLIVLQRAHIERQERTSKILIGICCSLTCLLQRPILRALSQLWNKILMPTALVSLLYFFLWGRRDTIRRYFAVHLSSILLAPLKKRNVPQHLGNNKKEKDDRRAQQVVGWQWMSEHVDREARHTRMKVKRTLSL